jgi:Protein of unknown function (DUF2867)
MTRVDQVSVPQRARQLAGLDRVDYADCFAVSVSSVRPPEEWIRMTVDAMPKLFLAVRAAHRTLGLPLAPANSADHLIGWDILRSEADNVVLGNAGVLGVGRIIGITSPDTVQLATLLTLNGWRGRALWAVAAPVHRVVARYALAALPVCDAKAA